MSADSNFAERAAAHTCHADGCTTHVPPAMFMCRRHWFMVPGHLRSAVWATYMPGQERRMDPSDEYLATAQRAIDAVAALEGRKVRPRTREATKPAAPTCVERFSGHWEPLSNFWRHPVTVEGVDYPSGEHAFGAAKTLDPSEAETIRSAPTPAAAKRASRAATLRPGWDGHYRYEAMRAVLAAKFDDEPARSTLLSTGDALLIEGNDWHDQHWGDCTCATHRSRPGANHLGRMLMERRCLLRGDPSPGEVGWRVPRVMVTGHRIFDSADQARWARSEIERLATKVRDDLGTTVAISGMALGADTWWAEAALVAGLELWAYVPFEGQAGTWPEADQERWAALRARAAREVVLGQGYDVALFHARNDAMLRDAEAVIAVADPARTTGGTSSTLRKARAAGKSVILVDVAKRRTTLRLPPAPSRDTAEETS